MNQYLIIRVNTDYDLSMNQNQEDVERLLSGYSSKVVTHDSLLEIEVVGVMSAEEIRRRGE